MDTLSSMECVGHNGAEQAKTRGTPFTGTPSPGIVCLKQHPLTYLQLGYQEAGLLCLYQHWAVNSECQLEMGFNQLHPGPESTKRYQSIQMGNLPDSYFVGFSLFCVLKCITWTRAQTLYLYDLKNSNKILGESHQLLGMCTPSLSCCLLVEITVVQNGNKHHSLFLYKQLIVDTLVRISHFVLSFCNCMLYNIFIFTLFCCCLRQGLYQLVTFLLLR